MREHKGKSLIALPSSYVVIDTETTGLDYDFCNLIEISAMKFQDDICVDKFSTLIQPPLRQCYRLLPDDDTMEIQSFYVDAFISDLTGITNEMLEKAPTPKQVIPQFIEFIGDSILVGHNVNFDINFLYDAALETCNVPLVNDFIDTLRISRKVFPELSHHRLSDIAEACEVPFEVMHRADCDCCATSECFKKMKAIVLANTTEADFAESFAYSYSRRLSSISATETDIDVTNPIYGKVVVFTGTLSSMSRAEAFQLVTNLGAVPQNSVNAKTNYLVIGSAEFVKSVKDGKTTKMKKAESLVKKNVEISVISEATFFDMISDYL